MAEILGNPNLITSVDNKTLRKTGPHYLIFIFSRITLNGERAARKMR